MYGAHYFEGGCSWSMESAMPQILLMIDEQKKLKMDADDNIILDKPQMFCYHPHGILCFGFIWNGGFRS